MSIQVNIKKSFGSFVLNLKFEAENDITGLLGASGCGKSMTLKCIAGIVRPDEGQIILDGTVLFDSTKRINLPPQKRHVGLLFQNYALFPNMTVKQNIMSVLRGNHRFKRFASFVDKFYLSGLENHYPAQLSGGQQQRAALARILASDPAILMLDEPLSALDSYLRWQLEEELARILEDFKGSTLYVSHNRDEVYRLCSKVCVMNGGRNEPVRSIEELFEAPGTLASSLLSGCKNYSRIERLSDRVLRAVDWNTELRSSAEITEDIHYVGVRSHFVRLFKQNGRENEEENTEENTFPCRVLQIVRDLFFSILSLQAVGTTSEHDFSHIRMEIPKPEAQKLRIGDIVSIKIEPENIMLLRK